MWLEQKVLTRQASEKTAFLWWAGLWRSHQPFFSRFSASLSPSGSMSFILTKTSALVSIFIKSEKSIISNDSLAIYSFLSLSYFIKHVQVCFSHTVWNDLTFHSPLQWTLSLEIQTPSYWPKLSPRKQRKSGTKCQAHRIAFTLETKRQGKRCDGGRMEVSESGLWSSGVNSFLKRKGRAGQFCRGICHSKTFMGTHAYETGSEYSWDRLP